jgi:hypothetical protein
MTKAQSFLSRQEVRHSFFFGVSDSQRLAPPAFRPRTNDEHHRLGEQYRQLSTPTTHKGFVKENATWYTQLSRLPYFDLVKQIVINPMHNLFLGS